MHGAHFRHRSFRIQGRYQRTKWLLQAVTHGRTDDEGHGRGDGAVLERRPGSVGNIKRTLHEVRHVLAQILSADIGNYADDRAPVLLADKTQVLSDGVLTGPQTARRFGAEEHDRRISGGVCFGELAAAENRDAHGAKITGRNGVEPEKRRRLSRFSRAAFEFDGAFVHATAERKSADERGSVHTGKRARLVEEIAIKRKTAVGIIAKRLRWSDARRQHVFGAEAWIDV